MSVKPRFQYFLYHFRHAVKKENPLWNMPLPLNNPQHKPRAGSDGRLSPSYGDYFNAARSFLQNAEFEMIVSAASQHTNQHVTADQIETIDIRLEKQGQLYHSAKIIVMIRGLKIPFVLNVAVSDTGKRFIKKEITFLKKLKSDFSFPFLPTIYGNGEVFPNNHSIEMPMFLGEWFEGFDEFHLSIDPADNRCKIAVWDPEGKPFFLTADQSIDLYKQASMIMTCYYRPATFEQIGAWHHAAGDFVIKIEKNQIKLRLISVRVYAPLFKDCDFGDGEMRGHLIVEGLLIFFLNLSIKMRLDRIDGIGRIVWSDDIAVEGIVKGFLKGLSAKTRPAFLPGAIDDCFRAYTSNCSRSDLLALSQSIADLYRPMTEEFRIIRQNLKRHVDLIYHAILR